MFKGFLILTELGKFGRKIWVKKKKWNENLSKAEELYDLPKIIVGNTPFREKHK